MRCARSARTQLARAFVAGASDTTKIDPMMALVRVLPGLEANHMRVMTVLAKTKPCQFVVDEVVRLDPVLVISSHCLPRTVSDVPTELRGMERDAAFADKWRARAYLTNWALCQASSHRAQCEARFGARGALR